MTWIIRCYVNSVSVASQWAFDQSKAVFDRGKSLTLAEMLDGDVPDSDHVTTSWLKPKRMTWCNILV